jgi:hypothetical protein
MFGSRNHQEPCAGKIGHMHLPASHTPNRRYSYFRGGIWATHMHRKDDGIDMVVTSTASPSQADDSSSDKLLDLHSDMGILHMLLQRRRIALCLLKDALHDRILEDSHDLQGDSE